MSWPLRAMSMAIRPSKRMGLSSARTACTPTVFDYAELCFGDLDVTHGEVSHGRAPCRSTSNTSSRTESADVSMASASLRV